MPEGSVLSSRRPVYPFSHQSGTYFLLIRDGPKKHPVWPLLTHYISVDRFEYLRCFLTLLRPSWLFWGEASVCLNRSSFSFPSLFHLITSWHYSWICWTSWVSSLSPLHPQVILVSQFSVLFFYRYVMWRGESWGGRGVPGVTGSPEEISQRITKFEPLRWTRFGYCT